MILNRKTPHGLGWAAGLGILFLAALLLPMLPSITRAQAAPEKDLDRIKEELKKKLAEIEDLKLKAEAIEKVRAQEAVRKALEAKKKAVDEAEAAKQRKPDENLTLRIEITGLDGNADDIKKLADMLQKSLPKNSKVLILGSRPGAQKGPEFEFRKDGEGWRFWKFKGDEKPKTVEVPKPKTGQYPTPVPTPPADKRIDGLEKKLEAIMKELEALRKEMKSRPGSRGFGFGGTAPRPADDDPKPK